MISPRIFRIIAIAIDAIVCYVFIYPITSFEVSLVVSFLGGIIAEYLTVKYTNRVKLRRCRLSSNESALNDFQKLYDYCLQVLQNAVDANKQANAAIQQINANNLHINILHFENLVAAATVALYKIVGDLQEEKISEETAKYALRTFTAYCETNIYQEYLERLAKNGLEGNANIMQHFEQFRKIE